MTRHLQIAQRAFNTPLLFDKSKAQAFLVGLGARILGGNIVLPSLDVPEERLARASRTGPRLSVIDGESGKRRLARGDRLYPVIDGVALIQVTGSLVHRGSWLEGSGVTSYERLHETIEAARVDGMVRGIALEVDSFGGEASGCFDLADHIREVRADKPIWAFVAESAFSGGYAIASQASRVILPRTGEVGSIGVLSMHVDYSDQLEMEGVKVTLITAGEHKGDGNPFEPLPEEVRASWQARAEDLRLIFAETVAAGRGNRFSADDALATEARCFMGEEAVSLGLADEVSDLRGAFAAFVEEINGRSAATITVGATVSAAEKETEMSKKNTPAAALEAEAPAGDPAEVETPTETEVETTEHPPAAAAETTEAAASIPVAQAAALAEVAAQASALGVQVDLAAAFKAGTTADALRASVMSQLAARSDQTAVKVTHPVKTSAESPIVAAAKKTAAAQAAAAAKQ